MTLSDPLMLQEAREAPRVVRRQSRENAGAVHALAAAIRERRPPYAVTVARGSSDHACTVLKYALETQLALPVASLGPSVHTLYGAQLDLRGALVIAVSQSGASPDVVENVRMAREGGATTVALVNVEDSDLAREAEFVLPLRCGEERAVAATKSYLASLTALLPVVAELTGDATLKQALEKLPEALERTLSLEDQARDLAERYRFADNLLVLARGLHFGVAQEAALKLKETCGIHAEAYSAAEFSHGPKRLLAEGVPLLGFTSADAAAAATARAYADLSSGGADLRTIGPAVDSTLTTPQTGHALTDPVPSALAFYLFAAHLALHRGLDPDAPPLLSKVTKTR
ncbi:SIS domain-containing protein (plasmid) [Deinococcus metallilatus]|uniref:Glucosamine--fructose-6-phosphate aminotransferase (Isomerizing) n=1 Tax=Deinococcus metallilatus TaxID=1211322 RepID=A0ABR6MVR3_9DEIO|nr:SIS domain-containing protein [Deinococcus metallilatus]MBB5295779.1 glucosamine--fructose-6-phosphate aminotransferase (isomerizing) [Deinococcus metallilatus]QBY06786.1 SIS domain-containing protein [Deinococcus metallilatus]GMA14308.1 glucosamine--fructose-6-phosphate aminotransferase [Deinococcus metallilatus]